MQMFKQFDFRSLLLAGLILRLDLFFCIVLSMILFLLNRLFLALFEIQPFFNFKDGDSRDDGAQKHSCCF